MDKVPGKENLYWNIGKIIKEGMMKSDRAEYGKQIVQYLSVRLIQEYGRGYSLQNLWYMEKYEIMAGENQPKGPPHKSRSKNVGIFTKVVPKT
jgi:hypothetical protein